MAIITIITVAVMLRGSSKLQMKLLVSPKERGLLNEKVIHDAMNYCFQNYWPVVAENILLNLLFALIS